MHIPYLLIALCHCQSNTSQQQQRGSVPMFLFCIETPCGLVGRHLLFRTTGLKRKAVSSSETSAYTVQVSTHGIIIQKTNINIFITVRTSVFVVRKELIRLPSFHYLTKLYQFHCLITVNYVSLCHGCIAYHDYSG
jgi:hypothetical protein